MGSSIIVDRGSDLWKTVMHEAAHWVAADEFGWPIKSIEIINARSGVVHTNDKKMWDRLGKRDPKKYDLYDGIISWAGPVVSLKMAYLFMPSACSYDEKDMNAVGARGRVSVGTIKSKTRSLVSRRWSMIERRAEQLYCQSISKGIKKNSWW